MKPEYANKILATSKAGYEKIADDFSRTRGKFWNELLFVRDLIPPNAHLLDIGCGNGRFLGALERADIDYTGVDFSEGLIDVARERYAENSRVHFLVGDALTLPFPDHTFDVVVSFAVLHHIPSHAYRVQFLREAARMVKPGGTIVITAWNVWHSKPRAVITTLLKKLCGLARLGFLSKNLGGLTRLDFGDTFLDFGKEQNVRYVHALTRREIRALAREAGLAIESLNIVRRPSGEENFVMILKS